MDFNDISTRLKRAHNAIDKQHEKDVSSNVKRVIEKSGKTIKVGVVFGKQDETEVHTRILGVISAIASLKDPLKKKLKEIGMNPNEVEELIDNSDELKLIMDLWNQDKHGYPLTRHNRSNKNPKIVNITQGLTMTEGTSASVSFSVTSSGIDSMSSSNNTVIKINADIVDEHGKFIITLDKMIEIGMKSFEGKIVEYNLG